jgi:16S rRNA (cytosine1402-N4)-methyltransferase
MSDEPTLPVSPQPSGAPGEPTAGAPGTHRRRPRYAGKNPRRFEEKYKEHQAEKYAADAARIEASGKTLAGTHRPILVQEILEVLRPERGESGVDCTLGYGGHARELLGRLAAPEGKGAPGRLLGLDVDPWELPRTEARLRGAGFGPEVFVARHSNFAGVGKVLAGLGWGEVDLVLADLGVSSMQLDNPERGFSYKVDGPLDLRLNPQRGVSAADWLAKVSVAKLTSVLVENADEPRAAALAEAMVARREQEPWRRTRQLAEGIRAALPGMAREEQDDTVRRVFQALRIAVNDEFSALDMWLRQLPTVLRPGGRVAVLTFHSGEDRRVKQAFKAGAQSGEYVSVARDVIRPTPEEQRANPRSSSAKLRWAIRAG